MDVGRWPGQTINALRFGPIDHTGYFAIDYILAGQPLDFDFDGIPDRVEGDASMDTDGDGIPDFADTDDDGLLNWPVRAAPCRKMIFSSPAIRWIRCWRK